MKPLTRTATLVLMIMAALAAVSPPAGAQDNTSRSQKVTAASYTDLGRFDMYEVDASSNAVALKLLAPSRARRVVVIKTDSSTNAVTVTTAGTSATVNGKTSFVLRSLNDSVVLEANGVSGANSFWRVAASNRRITMQTPDKTIATTGNTDFIVVAPESGTLVTAAFSPGTTLSADNTNYITFTITNLGQDGTGTNTMLASSPSGVNTTKATGGTALAADTKYVLTLNGTASSLAVTHGDRLRVRAAASGTLGGAISLATFELRFAGQ